MSSLSSVPRDGTAPTTGKEIAELSDQELLLLVKLMSDYFEVPKGEIIRYRTAVGEATKRGMTAEKNPTIAALKYLLYGYYGLSIPELRVLNEHSYLILDPQKREMVRELIRKIDGGYRGKGTVTETTETNQKPKKFPVLLALGLGAGVLVVWMLTKGK